MAVTVNGVAGLGNWLDGSGARRKIEGDYLRFRETIAKGECFVSGAASGHEDACRRELFRIPHGMDPLHRRKVPERAPGQEPRDR